MQSKDRLNKSLYLVERVPKTRLRLFGGRELQLGGVFSYPPAPRRSTHLPP